MKSTTDGSVLWSINQISNPSLNVTSETADAVDALGARIMQFNRAKNAEFSAENSLFDLPLLAAQSGSEVETSAADNTFNVPYFDEVKITTADTMTLAFTPASDTFKFLYKMNGDGTLGEKFTVGDTATGNTVTLSTRTVTFATGKAAVGDRFFAYYEYVANGTNEAARVTGDAVHYPKGGEFIMEVMGVDVCDPSTLYSAYIVFPNAKLTSDFDISFASDTTHPFTITAMQDYCDPDKVLFRVIIPSAQTAA